MHPLGIIRMGSLSEIRRIEKKTQRDLLYYEHLVQCSFRIWASNNGTDLYEYGDDEAESENDYTIYLARRSEKLKATVAGSIALELDNNSAKFQNDHLWYLSFDPSEKYTKEGEYCEDDLLSCLGCLELDEVFRFETQELPSKHYFKRLPLAKYIVPGMSISDYCRKIVRECYTKGKFETPLWKIENSSISARRK